MKVGYIRVFTIEQNEARQEVLMEQLGVDRVYMDRMSGKTKDLLSLTEELERKKVTFVSQKENIDTKVSTCFTHRTVYQPNNEIDGIPARLYENIFHTFNNRDRNFMRAIQ